MTTPPNQLDDITERISRGLFGLDARALDLVEGAFEEEPSNKNVSETDRSPTLKAFCEDDDDEDFADVLQRVDDPETDDALRAIDANDESAANTGGMGVPSPSAGFGMLDNGGSGRSKSDLYQKGSMSTMWAGLGVEDGGMGLREVSQNAADNGYAMFLDEVSVIQDVFAENGEVQLIRSRGDPAAGTTDAASASPTTLSETSRILAVRVQVMPVRILDEYNKKMNSNNNNQIFGTNDGAKKKACHRCTTKGLHVVATYVNGYPDRPPLISVEPWHNLLPTNAVISLNKKIVEIIANNIGGPALMSTLMMIAQEAEELVTSFDEGDIREVATSVRGVGIKTRLTSEAMHPDRYLGTNVADVLAKLPRHIQVQCVENVMRTDLALSFEKMQRYLFNKNVKPYMKLKNIRNQTHILEQAEAVPSFHGTRMDTVGYIVRDGLLVPGGDSGIAVRCGSRFGNGIYSSPDPNFASMYAECVGDHYKLLLCATLLGKRDYSDEWGELDGKCDSRVADDGLQYIVFHRAQILPCYVLHIKIFDPKTMQPVFPDLKKTIKAEMRELDTDAASGFFDPKEIQKRRREIFTQIARKNLPCGYGPRGIHFVVEDMAEVSDDDEYTNCVTLASGASPFGNAAEELYQHESIMKNRYGTSHKHPSLP